MDRITEEELNRTEGSMYAWFPKASLKRLINEIRSSWDEIKGLKAENYKLERACRGYQAFGENHQTEIKELKAFRLKRFQELATMRKENDELKANNEAQYQARVSLQHDINVLEEENTTLKAQVEAEK